MVTVTLVEKMGLRQMRMEVGEWPGSELHSYELPWQPLRGAVLRHSANGKQPESWEGAQPGYEHRRAFMFFPKNTTL